MSGRWIVPSELDGKRLDQALSGLLPELGLRGRKRLCEEGRVLLDGRPSAASVRLRAGQEVLVRGDVRLEGPGPRIVTAGEDYAALDKPAGLNSAALAGGGGESAEAWLTRLFPDRAGERLPLLCNRLDRPTSGLLLVAFGEAAREAFRRAEDAGLALKTYLAVVRGHPAERMSLSWPLDMAGRKRTRVLPGEADDLRATEVVRLARVDGGADVEEGDGLWLVAARIMKGARHQIRAHLAHAGHPILGDDLYGDEAGAGTGAGEKGSAAGAADGLHLHHFHLRIPGFEAKTPPPWPLWARLMEEASSEVTAALSRPDLVVWK
ncbi:pseudouridine synthase [Desulfovibrio sp. X2]|uniref:pseudouridine synthase family protein n=1 Tax=Desulfovibrio sp. X2 TaxID=941449 RepID=UPI000358C8F2|nr:RluA family pseudouridine synthase [Desulfovibrio sp. X2]EPR39364.1 pseudouridine synthase [Desulfovibrio sp. X2]